jgi:hypothetical protein
LHRPTDINKFAAVSTYLPSSHVLCILPCCPAVTASQVPGSEGALALYLLPRFLLINTLDVPIQYKQQVRTAYCTACGRNVLPVLLPLGGSKRCRNSVCAGRAECC